MMRAATLCCAFLLLLAPGTVLSQEHGEGDHNIGTVDFGVSCAPEVRGDFA
jgi:hypothetical protein